MDIEDISASSRSTSTATGDTCSTPTRVIPRVSKKRREEAYGHDIPGAQTVFVKTYGCSHNVSDSETMVGQLAEFGYGITEDFDAADAFLVSLCDASV